MSGFDVTERPAEITHTHRPEDVVREALEIAYPVSKNGVQLIVGSRAIAALDELVRERDEAESSWVLQVASLERRAEAAERERDKYDKDRRTAMAAAERFREQGMKDSARVQELETALTQIDAKDRAGRDVYFRVADMGYIARRALGWPSPEDPTPPVG